MGENNVISNEVVNNAVENVVEALPTAVSKDKPSWAAIGLLAFAGIGVISTGYFLYKGVKYVVIKLKDGTFKIAKAQPAQQPAEAPKQAETAAKAPANEEKVAE